MREHARLHEAGVLSKLEYEASKARILAAHASGGPSVPLAAVMRKVPSLIRPVVR
jgi:hypothetical protein